MMGFFVERARLLSIVSCAALIAAVVGCGDSGSVQGGGNEGGAGAGAGADGGGTADPQCASVTTFGKTTSYLLGVEPHSGEFGVVRDLDGDGDRDVLVLWGLTGSTEIVQVLNTGDGVEPQPVVVLSDTIAEFVHPSDPSILVVISPDRVAWLDIDSLEEVESADCTASFSAGSVVYSPTRPIDIDADGSSDVLFSAGFVSDPSIGAGVLSVSSTDPCGLTLTRIDPDPGPAAVIDQTPDEIGNEIWFSGGFSLADGQGISGDSIAMAELPSDITLNRGFFGDVDNDGELELVGTLADSVRVIEISQAAWGASVYEGDGQVGNSVELVDVDCDGDLDLICQRQLWANDGTGVFELATEFDVVTDNFVLREDFTGDGIADFIMLDDASVQVLEGAAP